MTWDVRHLREVDLSPKLSKLESEKALVGLQRRLLHLRLVTAGLLGEQGPGPGLLVIFEGFDAAGKGGAIKRLVARLDPRHVKVAGFAAPNDEERRHHFLWRFGPALPGLGEMSVFDRSWYGRVLVERVEQLVTRAQWHRAYDEICDFEQGLVAEGVAVVKIFLHLSDEEQLRRFEDRRADPLRRWKLTDEDWRNRARRSEYVEAVDDMLQRTDHHDAPWDVLAGESKHYARVAVLKTVIRRLEQGMRRLGIEPPESTGSDFDPGSAA